MTVIVPTCGYHFLQRALSSVIMRAYQDFAICVNSSTDPRGLGRVISSCTSGVGVICQHFSAGLNKISLPKR